MDGVVDLHDRVPDGDYRTGSSNVWGLDRWELPQAGHDCVGGRSLFQKDFGSAPDFPGDQSAGDFALAHGGTLGGAVLAKSVAFPGPGTD